MYCMLVYNVRQGLQRHACILHRVTTTVEIVHIVITAKLYDAVSKQCHDV